MILSGSSDGAADTLVDDVLILKIVHPDSSTSTFKHDYSHGCGPSTSLPPNDLSSLFERGFNMVTVMLKAEPSLRAHSGSPASDRTLDGGGRGHGSRPTATSSPALDRAIARGEAARTRSERAAAALCRRRSSSSLSHDAKTAAALT
jgi:hypothetical protein